MYLPGQKGWLLLLDFSTGLPSKSLVFLQGLLWLELGELFMALSGTCPGGSALIPPAGDSPLGFPSAIFPPVRAPVARATAPPLASQPPDFPLLPLPQA